MPKYMDILNEHLNVMKQTEALLPQVEAVADAAVFDWGHSPRTKAP